MSLQQLVLDFGDIVILAVKLVAALGFLIFLWGAAQLALNAGNEEAQKAGRNRIVWGLITLFVMVSVWGLVHFLQVAVGFDVDGGPIPPIQVTPSNPPPLPPNCVTYPGGTICTGA